MNKSDTISELAKALSVVQGGLTPVGKDSENPFYHSKYASLDAVCAVVLPLLSQNGLSVAQFPTANGLESMLMHSSGEWISSEVAFEVDTSNPQKIGSAITYMRRYALMSIVGAVAGDDDDGNSTVPETPPQKPRQPQPEPTDKATPLPPGELKLADIKMKRLAIGIESKELSEWVRNCHPADKDLPNKALIIKHADWILERIEKDNAKAMIETGLPF